MAYKRSSVILTILEIKGITRYEFLQNLIMFKRIKKGNFEINQLVPVSEN